MDTDKNSSTGLKWVNCEDCKHHHWEHGHMWTCNQKKAIATLDMRTGLVQCIYFKNKTKEG
jgi:hypothetical protein